MPTLARCDFLVLRPLPSRLLPDKCCRNGSDASQRTPIISNTTYVVYVRTLGSRVVDTRRGYSSPRTREARVRRLPHPQGYFSHPPSKGTAIAAKSSFKCVMGRRGGWVEQSGRARGAGLQGWGVPAACHIEACLTPPQRDGATCIEL